MGTIKYHRGWKNLDLFNLSEEQFNNMYQRPNISVLGIYTKESTGNMGKYLVIKILLEGRLAGSVSRA